MTHHIQDQNDLKAKLDEAGGKLVVIDFFALWCGPCKMIAPKLEELAIELNGAVVFLKVDVDECEEIAVQYNISSMPTFVFIKNSGVVSSFTGANYDKLKSHIQQLQ